MNVMLTTSDLKQIKKIGISEEQIEWQLSVFQKGPAYIKLQREALSGDGIQLIDDKEADRLIQLYDKQAGLSKIKFVPASGAATRMFKNLYDYLDAARKRKPSWNSFLETFFTEITKYAFYDLLKSGLTTKKLDIHKLILEKKYESVLEYLLMPSGLNYGSLPKGLLKFHRYGNHARTPFEEHIAEAAMYAVTDGQPVQLHFTVSAEHMEGFTKLLTELLPSFEKRFDLNFNIHFSIQKTSTDTLAVDMHNDPFRNDDGSMLFRPGGHGSLIDNLNDLDADLIFIKNIDNVVPERLITQTVRYKKVLAGKLFETQQKIVKILHELEFQTPSLERIKQIVHFVRTGLCYEMSKKTNPDSIPRLKSILNRPLRVCGVVKNVGEPGGGPFWAPNASGDISLQIVESSQVNHADLSQVEIFARATHFNPVDLVCGPRDVEGNKFDLRKYVDKNTCFISQKSKDGKELKALELPGLWNGAMSDWLTLFVEVPIETFNPVKTVNDLLRPQHQ
jgi:hypothetical protein